jgi:hypothetical protein
MAGADLSFDNRDLRAATSDSCGHLLALLGNLAERAAVAFLGIWRPRWKVLSGLASAPPADVAPAESRVT